MKKCQYKEIESYMLECMKDTVHDKLHVCRVVNYAVQIMEKTKAADFDIVVAAALLHDIGRTEEQQDKNICHAEVGSKKASEYLLSKGYSENFVRRVSQCILSHRHKKGIMPESLEAKIVYDADKLDLIGSVGVARAILFGGQIGEPLYRLDETGLPAYGFSDEAPSLFREYHRKLCRLSDKLYTDAAKDIAIRQQESMNRYFEALIQEVKDNCLSGQRILDSYFGSHQEGEARILKNIEDRYSL